MLGRNTMASSGLFHEPKLIKKGFVDTDGFLRGGLQEMRRFHRGDVGFVGRVVFFL